MISYDLAEQLKDAGFSLRKSGNQKDYLKDRIVIDNVRYAIPTLSELVSACGDDFMSLMLWPEPRGDLGRWTADTRRGRARGNTPEEATAKAWLLLNKAKK